MERHQKNVILAVHKTLGLGSPKKNKQYFDEECEKMIEEKSETRKKCNNIERSDIVDRSIVMRDIGYIHSNSYIVGFLAHLHFI